MSHAAETRREIYELRSFDDQIDEDQIQSQIHSIHNDQIKFAISRFPQAAAKDTQCTQDAREIRINLQKRKKRLVVPVKRGQCQGNGAHQK